MSFGVNGPLIRGLIDSGVNDELPKSGTLSRDSSAKLTLSTRQLTTVKGQRLVNVGFANVVLDFSNLAKYKRYRWRDVFNKSLSKGKICCRWFGLLEVPSKTTCFGDCR